MKILKTMPALLTRTEIEWLLNHVKISKAYEYRIKSDIKKKMRIFTELELPLLVKNGFLDNSYLSKYNQNLRTNPQIASQDISANSSDLEIPSQNMVGRKGCVTISVLKEGS